MDKFIFDQEEKVMLGEDDLKTIAGDEYPIVTYRDIPKARSIDQILGKAKGCFILLEEQPNVGHWVVLFKNGNTIEYNDSYGVAPDGEISYFNLGPKLNQEFGYVLNANGDYPLTALLKKSGCKIIYNKVKLQKDSKNANTCGRFSAFRLCMRDMPLDEYNRRMAKCKYPPDEMVTLLTAFAV